MLTRLKARIAGLVMGIAIAGMAFGAATSNYWQNNLIDAFLRAQTTTNITPGTVYIALDTTAGSAQGCGTEVSGAGYSRPAVVSSLANWAGTQGTGTTSASSNSTGSTGTTSNNNSITYGAPTANWGTIVGFCGMSASSGGNMLFYAPLTTPKTVNNGDAAPSFAAGALTFTIGYVVQDHWALQATNDDLYRIAA